MEDLNLYANYDISLIIDGQEIQEICKNEKISISRYEHDAIFLRFNKNKLRQTGQTWLLKNMLQIRIFFTWEFHSNLIMT